MYTLARDWLPWQDAMAAGVLYAVNPYHLVIVYWRSDFAELLAMALFPLVFLGVFRICGYVREFRPAGGFPDVAALALPFAAVWLANAPAAVILIGTIRGSPTSEPSAVSVKRDVVRDRVSPER